MSHRSVGRLVCVGLLTMTLAVAFPRIARASDIILIGFDLFGPLAGTQIGLPGLGLTPFLGVPVGFFDFGLGMGPVPTGNTDTIVRRLQVAVPNHTIDIELLAMQVVNAIPIDLGAGLDFHFLTPQSGTTSLGTMMFQVTSTYISNTLGAPAAYQSR